jgi:predicted phage terminase large subunit-like protein
MTMHLALNELRPILRQDLYAFTQGSFYELNPETEFKHNWHIEVICAELEKCRRGGTKRLIITVPPRSLKSHCVSVVFPAWILGHHPWEQIICVSYGQDLANNLASGCRSLMSSEFYRNLFPTRLSPQRQAVNEFATTRNGFRMATSVGGVLTGRGANFIIIDDPLKPDEAISETQRKAVNDWYLHSLYSRLNDKRTGCIILIMQRLHEEDLVGHVLALDPSWRVLKFPAIAEEDEVHRIESPFGPREFRRSAGEALHPEREPLQTLEHLRETLGEYNFAGQYQQAPAPFGGGMVKVEWFKTYTPADLPPKFDALFQSWDTANKPKELNDYSVCTTWGVKDVRLYLLHVYRKRLGYPELKRAVREQADAFFPKTILIEDKASGTQLIQDLVYEGMHAIKRYEPTLEKIARLSTATGTIENGFVYLPEKAPWLAEYLHELSTFPKGRHDDQADSTSQALDWFKLEFRISRRHPLIEYYRLEDERMQAQEQAGTMPSSQPCSKCNGVMAQRIPGGLRCAQCGAQWSPVVRQPGGPLTRADVLRRTGLR